EINDLHKQMLRTSAKVAAMARDPADRGDAHDPAREAAVEVATDQLYRGQSNDCYWHGLFGGIYISHMRAATFAALIAAEDAADAALGTLDAAEQADLDLDGRDELLLANAGEVVTVDLDEGGGIGSWDLRAARHAVGAVLRRRPEAYHERLRALDAPEASAAATAATVSTPDGGPDGESGPERPASSIHDGTKAKEAGLAGRLVYDDYERRSGLIRALDPGDGPAGWRAGGGPDLGDPAAPMTVRELGRGRVVLTGDSRIAGQAVRIEKELQLGGGRLDPSLALAVTVEHRGDAPISARLGLEWVSTMLGGGANPAAWWEIAGRRGSHDGAGQAEQVGGVAQGNDWLGITIDTIIEPAADAWWAPIETVSNSEAGVERAYQGSALLVSMAVELAPGQRWTLRLEHRVSTRQDRAEDGNSSEPKPASG
ncbi:MAG TPA: alpha-amylase/4-alpha-glucanotransferase domain-containing protein, partial [Candidatus Limnocylindrales bacterium]